MVKVAKQTFSTGHFIEVLALEAMSKGQWRARHEREHWTKRIDISLLYQLDMISAEMKKRAEEAEDKELQQWASSIRLIVARANGEELNIPLTKHQIKSPDVVRKD